MALGPGLVAKAEESTEAPPDGHSLILRERPSASPERVMAGQGRRSKGRPGVVRTSGLLNVEEVFGDGKDVGTINGTPLDVHIGQPQGGARLGDWGLKVAKKRSST